MTISLIVGLGNPGSRYDQTRHNAGFWFLDALAAQHGGQWAQDSKHQALVCKLSSPRPVWLLKPQTFMNESGRSVGSFLNFYRLDPAQMLVVHDELDLMPGDIRLKLGGGHAGHNGLRDIADKLGHGQYWRMRVGIGHPRTLNLQQGVSDFVLHRPGPDEQAAIEQRLSAYQKALTEILSDPAAAQRTLNLS